MREPKQNTNTGNAWTDACVTSSENISGEHWRWCPQCGHELINEKCKLRCPRCHYFMSCSDFDFAG
jgi:Zn finger protein HypA/HybF involved in hydrogenase expression